MRSAPPRGWDMTFTTCPVPASCSVALRSSASKGSPSPGRSKRTLTRVALLTRRLNSSLGPMPGKKFLNGLGFIRGKFYGLIDRHRCPCLPGGRKFILGESRLQELTVTFHFHTV